MDLNKNNVEDVKDGKNDSGNEFDEKLLEAVLQDDDSEYEPDMDEDEDEDEYIDESMVEDKVENNTYDETTAAADNITELDPPKNGECFEDLDSAEFEIVKHGWENGYMIGRARTLRRNGTIYRIILECGKARKGKNKCPFKTSLKRHKDSGSWTERWKVVVHNGYHNHGRLDNMESAYLRKCFLRKYRVMVMELIRENVDTDQILAMLNGLESGVMIRKTEITALRNEVKTNREQKFSGLEVLTHRFPKTGDGFSEFLTGTDLEKGVFLFNKSCVELLRRFQYVLVLQSKVKENRFKMPVMTITAVGYGNRTFLVGVGFLMGESRTSYEYILKSVNHLYRELRLSDPETILCKYDRSLVKSIRRVFPGSNVMFCLHHAAEMIKAHARPFLKSQILKRNPRSDANQISSQLQNLEISLQSRWDRITSSTSQEHFVEAKDKFLNYYKQHAKFVQYVSSTWLDPVSLRSILACYTNHYFHLGNTTLPQDSDINSYVVSFLYTPSSQSPLLNLCRTFELLVTQHTLNLFSELVENVDLSYESGIQTIPNFAFQLIQEIRKLESPSNFCTGLINQVYGVPCPHQSQHLDNDDFHPFWIYKSVREQPIFNLDGFKLMDQHMIEVTARSLRSQQNSPYKQNDGVEKQNSTSKPSGSIKVLNPVLASQYEASSTVALEQH